MSEYTHVENAIIENADVQISRGFILDCWVHLKYKSGGQGFGGYALGGISGGASDHANQPNLAAEFLCGIMRAAGVESLSAMKGKTVRVGKDSDFGSILAIGHIVDDDKWFNPKERFDALIGNHAKRQTEVGQS